MTPEMDLDLRQEVAALKLQLQEMRVLLEAVLEQNDILINYARTTAMTLGLRAQAQTAYHDLEKREADINKQRKALGY